MTPEEALELLRGSSTLRQTTEHDQAVDTLRELIASARAVVESGLVETGVNDDLKERLERALGVDWNARALRPGEGTP